MVYGAFLIGGILIARLPHGNDFLPVLVYVELDLVVQVEWSRRGWDRSR